MSNPSADYSAFTSLPPTDRLAGLAAMAEALRIAEGEVLGIEEQLVAAKARVAEMAERQIPELMDGLGMEEFRLKGGAIVKLTKTLSVSLPKETKNAAHDWLEAHGLAGLIKRVVEVAFTREQQNRAKSLVATLQGEYENVKMERWVEPQTLKAEIARLMRDGKEVPKDLINISERRVAKVEMVKKK